MNAADLPTPKPTTETRGDVTIVRVVGDIDIANSDELHDACTDLLTPEAQVLVIDLSGVTFFASSGIAALGRIREHNAGRRVVRVVASRGVRRSLEVTAMDKLLPLHDTVDDALAAVRADVS